MTVVAAGRPAPDFTLATYEGQPFTRSHLEGKTTVLVFYPFAFSSVCTDQFNIYDEVLDDFSEKGAVLYGVSTDASDSQTAFREKLGVRIEMLSDFEPKGEAARRLGAYFEPGGMTNRALVIVGPDGVVTWSWEGDTPGDLPGANLIFDGLEAGH